MIEEKMVYWTEQEKSCKWRCKCLVCVKWITDK